MMKNCVSEAEVAEAGTPEANLGSNNDLIEGVLSKDNSVVNHKGPVREEEQEHHCKCNWGI